MPLATLDARDRVAALLRIDARAEIARLEQVIRTHVAGPLHRRGVVVGVSGGIDSSVVCLLAARALGPGRVLALCLPEREGPSTSVRLGRLVAERAGAAVETVAVGPLLEAAGCFQEQSRAVRTAIPEFGDGWEIKLSVPSLLERERLNVFTLEARDPEGGRHRARLSAAAYRHLIAATNMKQRARKGVEYFWADRLGYAVAGTPNRLEYDQGFFVKNGDGAADLKPIAHLLKTQVYQLAEALGVPEEIRTRTPTTETFALDQTQEEFYFGAPLWVLDWCLHGLDRKLPPEAVAEPLGLSTEQVTRIQADLLRKREATRYLRLPALLAAEEA
ncbi:MAG: NAD(+) synthase [Candidatus Dormibacteraceae bacterium]